MKTIEEYMKLPYRMEIIQDPDEGGYVASYPDLPGCLTSADSIGKVVENAAEAKADWLRAAMEDGYPIPEPDTLDKYSGQTRLRLPRSLHRSLAINSKREGVSMNSYCVYLLAKNNALEEERLSKVR